MPDARSLQEAELPGDIRLVVADLDGTLLDEDGAIPPGFWPVLQRLRRRQIVFAPASGRQYPALARLFGEASADFAVIAENGAYVLQGGEEVSSATLPQDFAQEAVRQIRRLAAERDLALVWSARQTAFVERSDEKFLEAAGQFFFSLSVVPDLLELEEDALKLGVYDFGAVSDTAELLGELFSSCQVVRSTDRWIDIMDRKVNKGVALRALRHSLGVTKDQTVVFGDYLNDREMMAEATHSFAMANAHPEIVQIARHLAPSNRDHGVVTTLGRMLSA